MGQSEEPGSQTGVLVFSILPEERLALLVAEVTAAGDRSRGQFDHTESSFKYNLLRFVDYLQT